MTRRQLDLFSGAGVLPPSSTPRSGTPGWTMPSDLGDDALVAAIADAGLADASSLAAEAGRRRLAAAAPALEDVCRRFAGFGVDRAIPEQVAAIEALAVIGGAGGGAHPHQGRRAGACRQGRGRGAAAQLGAELPAAVVLTLLRHSDRSVRAAACRCVRTLPEAIPILVDLLQDLHSDVSGSAACALGRSGRAEARPALIRLLKKAPSPEVIDAVAGVADDDCVVLLARLARTKPGIARDALNRIDHPRAAQVLATLTRPRDQESDDP